MLCQLKDRRRDVAAVLNQENWTDLSGVADLQHQARELGWKFAPSPAAKGKRGGPSAGVGVAVPSHLGWGTAPGHQWDLSPAGSPGRIAAAWVQAGGVGGLLVITVYLWTTEGLTPRNVAIIERAVGTARSYGALWIIGGDFNVPPAVFKQLMHALLDRAGAVVRAPADPTHYPARGKPEVLDYFVVDKRLDAGFVEVAVDLSIGLKPHRAVCIGFNIGKASGLVTSLRRPRAFPRQKPTGCARTPTVPAEGVLEPDAGGTLRDIDGAWRTIAACAEHEWCGILDLVDGGGNPLPQYCGRGRPMETVQRPNLPPKICGPIGRVDRVAHAMRWALVRV